MNLADLLARRTAAALAFDAAEKAHHTIGGTATWKALEAARVERRAASDAVDAAG